MHIILKVISDKLIEMEKVDFSFPKPTKIIWYEQSKKLQFDIVVSKLQFF